MALYLVKDAAVKDDKGRLIDAASSAAAVNHVVNNRFAATTISTPAEAAKLAAGGIKVETAGEAQPAATPPAEDNGGDDNGGAD